MRPGFCSALLFVPSVTWIFLAKQPSQTRRWELPGRAKILGRRCPLAGLTLLLTLFSLAIVWEPFLGRADRKTMTEVSGQTPFRYKHASRKRMQSLLGLISDASTM